MGRELSTGPTEPVVWTKLLSESWNQVILELWACWEDLRNILTQKAWLQIGGRSGWGSAFSSSHCWLPPWRSKVSWKGLLGSGGWTCLKGLGGGEWLPTYSTAVPWHSRSAKVSFLDFKLCAESQSSEFSQTEGWVSSPCSLCETEARIKEKTVKREGKAQGVLGPSTGTPGGASLTGPTQESLFRNSPCWGNRCVQRGLCCGPPAPSDTGVQTSPQTQYVPRGVKGSLPASCLVRDWIHGHTVARRRVTTEPWPTTSVATSPWSQTITSPATGSGGQDCDGAATFPIFIPFQLRTSQRKPNMLPNQSQEIPSF